MPQDIEISKESGTQKFRMRTTLRPLSGRWEARVYVETERGNWCLAWKRVSRSREGVELLASGFRRGLLESTLSFDHFLRTLGSLR